MESFLTNRPDTLSRCTYTVNDDKSECSHNLGTKQKSLRQKVYSNVLELIGDTPLVRINRLGSEAGLKCNLLAKLEYLNAGGSIKDRIGLRMVEEAEGAGILKPGDAVIEATSGNTGIGLALACAVKNYRCIIVMPEKMSKEKADVLRALGAEVIRTPTGATKFLSDDWMYEREFLDIKDEPNSEWWHSMPISSLSLREPVMVSSNTTIQAVLDIMYARGFDQVPVISDDGTFVGMTTLCEIMAKMSRGTINAQDQVSKAVTDKFRTVQLNDSLAKLSRILEAHNYVIIKFAHDHYLDQSTRQHKTHIFGIITSIDLLEFIVKRNESNKAVKLNSVPQEEKTSSTVAKESEALQ
ncbi:unnamed protein product [Rotaria sp. Silwood1]|nr:unnamed protein product [Rotaria sp. Silwood1]